jgi:glycosyltransferase involved in cell wall biosynthesis
MFSVIIPLFNKSEYIEKTIKSVLDQSFRDFELIVVNDESTDGGEKKIENFPDERIILVQQSRSGVSVARNKGVERARHNYIAFLDADDWWDPNFLAQMKVLIDRYPHAGLYGSNFYLVKNGVAKSSTVGLESNFKDGIINYYQVYSNTFCVPINCSFVVLPKKVFVEQGGFNSQLRYGEDFELWARIALKYEVAYLNEKLAYSNQDVTSHTRALGSNKLYEKNQNFIFNLKSIEQYESKSKSLKKLLDGLRVRSLLRYHLTEKYSEEVKEQLLKVDFSEQPLFFRLIYSVPLPLIKIYFKTRGFFSFLKQMVLNGTMRNKIQTS